MKKLTILKIGGKLLDDPASLHQVLKDFSSIEGGRILVHGGGKKSNALCRQLGIEPRMAEGRRITDVPTLEIVTMVYAGLLNKSVVSQLQSLGCNALGLSGADGNSILAEKRAVGSIDYGFAGDIMAVNTAMIINLLDKGVTPVFCAITHDGKGQLLNTNADTIATSLATALAPCFTVTLKYCFEKNGVLRDPADDNSVFPALTFRDYQDFKKIGVISEGMIPKLDNAFSAKNARVAEVFICGKEGIKDQLTHQGTKICL